MASNRGEAIKEMIICSKNSTEEKCKKCIKHCRLRIISNFNGNHKNH